MCLKLHGQNMITNGFFCIFVFVLVVVCFFRAGGVGKNEFFSFGKVEMATFSFLSLNCGLKKKKLERK